MPHQRLQVQVLTGHQRPDQHTEECQQHGEEPLPGVTDVSSKALGLMSALIRSTFLPLFLLSVSQL